MKAVRLCLQETEERDRTATMLVLPDAPHENLESVCFLWLDASANSSEANLATQKRFHSIIHPFRVFVNVQDCELFIRSQCTNDRIYLIANGMCGQDIVPRLEQCRQLSSIYVYCRDKERNEAWAKHFPKVTSIVYSSSKKRSEDSFGFDQEYSHISMKHLRCLSTWECARDERSISILHRWEACSSN